MVTHLLVNGLASKVNWINKFFMKKNTLFVSLLAGLGSLAAVFTVINSEVEAEYSPREVIGDSMNASKRSEFFSYMRKNVNTGRIEPDDYINAIAATKNSKVSRAANLNWEFSGPDNIGGRTRAVIIDNVDPNRIYAGSIGGGMYVSEDAAGTWTYKSDTWENLQVSTIIQDPDGRLYVGTGNTNDGGPATNGAFPGTGIYTSDDRGETWSLLASTMPVSGSSDWVYVNRISLSHNKNSQGNYTVYAATNTGLRVSLDNGLTWNNPVRVPNNCSVEFNNDVDEVVVTSTDRVLISLNGVLYVSESGETDCSYVKIDAQSGLGSCTRLSLAVCSSDENIVYAFQSFSGATQDDATFKILTSFDGGLTWGPLSPAPPSIIIDPSFDMMGGNGAGYNQAISVDPNDCDRIYVGAVSLYRVDGSWTSVATNFGAPDFYVHSDKHWFQFSQHTPNLMYVASDGGIGKTENAHSSRVTWTDNNRHYGTAQYYGIAFTKEGRIIGGTQDNGSHLIDPRQQGQAGMNAVDINGGDGFDCEASNLGDFIFSTIYHGDVTRRANLSGGIFQTRIHPRGDYPTSPFHTVIRLWESENDLTSKEFILFSNVIAPDTVGLGDGVRKSFDGTLNKPQEVANIVPGSILFKDIAGNQQATDINSNGILMSFGDSIGVIDYNTGDYELRWAFAPQVAATVNVVFEVTYDSGDILSLQSKNAGILFDYELPNNVAVGDTFSVQDPVQTLMAVSMMGGVSLSRESMYVPLGAPAFEFFRLGRRYPNGPHTPISAISPTAMEYSNDGNHLFVATRTGSIYRISNLNDWYMNESVDSVLIDTLIFSGSGPVAGINMHPTDPEKLLVTLGGFGNRERVFEITNAISSSAIAARRDVSGDLPDFPVYDPEYNIHNTDQVLIGTEFGVWSTEDLSSGSPSWTQQSNGLGNVPVIDVRQQRLSFHEAANFGRFYIGTYGRGIWTTGDLVSVDEPWEDFVSIKNISNVKTYPNPVRSFAKISFEMPISGAVRITIYDISGKLITNEVRNFAAGEVEYQINGSKLPAGTYFANLEMGSTKAQTKFVVIK